MSRKKKDEEGSSHFLTALIGIGIGAIGGFLLNKFVNSEGSQEAPRQARQAPIQVEPERRSARQNDSKIGTADETL